MAILCVDYNLLFAHVPRTGGRFVEEVLLEHLDGSRVGKRHDTFRRLDRRRMPATRVFAVRDTLSWYQSYWAFGRHVARRKSVWPTWDDGSGAHPTAELDRTCGYPEFEQFIRAALGQFPNGFVRSMYCAYLNGATQVLRTSHLAEDLEALLRLVDFDRPSVVRDRPPVNASPKRLKDRAVVPETVGRLVREIDNLEGLAFPFVVATTPEVPHPPARADGD